MAADSAATLKKYKWMDPNGTAVDAALGQDIAALSKTLGSDAVQEPCGRSRRNLSQCKLPASQAAALRQKIAFVQAGDCRTESGGQPRPSASPAGIGRSARQTGKTAGFPTIPQTAQEKLAAIADKLNNLKTDDDLKPVAIHAIHSPGGTAQTQVKPTNQPLEWQGDHSAHSHDPMAEPEMVCVRGSDVLDHAEAIIWCRAHAGSKRCSAAGQRGRGGAKIDHAYLDYAGSDSRRPGELSFGRPRGDSAHDAPRGLEHLVLA